jgi:hypothetical protein
VALPDSVALKALTSAVTMCPVPAENGKVRPEGVNRPVKAPVTAPPPAKPDAPKL